MVTGIITWFIIVNIVITIVLFVSSVDAKKIVLYLLLSVAVQAMTLFVLLR